MKKVYPSPKCNATDGMVDLKQNFTITNVRNGLFYTSNISLVYKIIDKCCCNRTIVVICIIGQTSFTVVNDTVPCLEVATNDQSRDDSPSTSFFTNNRNGTLKLWKLSPRHLRFMQAEFINKWRLTYS